jgi:FkbM family methyltransferase
MDATLTYDGCNVTFYSCDPNDEIQGRLLKGEWYEQPNLEFIRSLNVEGCYLDIGAYIGTHTLFFALFCQTQSVYAYEPQIAVYKQLHNNIMGNALGGKVISRNSALSNQNGLCNISATRENRGGGRIIPGNDIQLTTLDNDHLPNIVLAKIDVEGAELKVLQGGKATLSQANHIFIEMWPEHVCKDYNVEYTRPQIELLLADWGLKHQRELYSDLHWFNRR